MKLCKLLLATLGAAVLLGALAGGASAGRLSTSSQTWRVGFRSLRFQGVFGNINCAVTLEGSIHARTIAKTAASLIGYVTQAAVGTCVEGRWTMLRETLPWHVRYASFTGTLPNIAAIRANIIGFAWRIGEPLATCLSTTTAERPITLTLTREATGALSTAELNGTVPTTCGIEGTWVSDRAPVTVLNSAARITVTLI